MKNVNKLIAIIMIALFAINFISCDSDEENTKPTIKEYPKQVSITEIVPCGCSLEWGNIMLDSLNIVNDTVAYNKYCHHLSNCSIDFSQNSILILYSWYYETPNPNVIDTLWKLSSNEYRWDIHCETTPSDSNNHSARFSLTRFVPKIPDSAIISVNISR
jgi:hypothetical protein